MKSYFERFVAFSREKNIVAKAVSLMLALILWAYLNNSRVGRIRVDLPIEYRNLAPTLLRKS